MAFAVGRFQVDRLHERVDVGHLEYTFMLVPPYAVTPLGDRSFVFGDHLALLCRVLPYNATHRRRGMYASLILLFVWNSQKYHLRVPELNRGLTGRGWGGRKRKYYRPPEIQGTGSS
jgi:hypothetical protein